MGFIHMKIFDCLLIYCFIERINIEYIRIVNMMIYIVRYNVCSIHEWQ